MLITGNIAAPQIFYSNNISLLEKFIQNFKIVAKDLLKESFQNRHIYSQCTDKLYLTTESFKQKLLPTRNQDIKDFTHAESPCLQHLKQGLKTKEIARILEKSPRTVEKQNRSNQIKIEGVQHKSTFNKD